MGKTGQGLADYAISKLGTPYFFGSKMNVLTEAFMQQMHNAYPGTVTGAYMKKARTKGMVGKKCCDCSGLIGAYREKQIGSSQLYSTAKKRLPIANVSDFAVGTVLWKSGHVGVYIGNGYCVEEKGINYGCVKTKVSATKWKYGLTFSDMTYSYDTKVAGTSKKANPYAEPTSLVKNGTRGESAKWVQFELNEAGANLTVDGIFGAKSVAELKAFQASCKITVDGICGATSRKHLKAK